MIQILGAILLFFVSQFSWASTVAQTYDYQADSFKMLTWDNYIKRIEARYPTLLNTQAELASFEEKGQSYLGRTLATEGLYSGQKIIQKLTFIQEHPGLWKMVRVESQSCTKGLVPDGQGGTQETWGCREQSFPLGSYAEVFVIHDNQVDLAALSASWGREVRPFKTSEAPVASAAHEMTLADMRKKILDQGSSWRVEPTVWSGIALNPVPEQQAIRIHVVANFNKDKRAEQSFLYVINGDNLHLKEIDGKLCTWVERLDKDICEDLFTPTSVTDFPLTLLNSEELSDPSNKESNVATGEDASGVSSGAQEGLSKSGFVENTNTVEPAVGPNATSISSPFPCGNLGVNLQSILQYHFERGLFSLATLENERRFFAEFPEIADPQGLLLSNEDRAGFLFANQAPYPQDTMLTKVKAEIDKGVNGDCSLLVNYIDLLKEKVLIKSAEAQQALRFLRTKDFEDNKIKSEIGALSPWQQMYVEKIYAQRSAALAAANPSRALDVSAGNYDRLLKIVLNRLSNYEEFVTAAMAKQDLYYGLFEHNAEMESALNGVEQSKFFGLSVVAGYSGRHYLDRVHPRVESQYGIKTGDEIVSVNSRRAQELSSQQVDAILVDTKNTIELVLKNRNDVKTVRLQAQELDLMEYFYTLEVIQSENKNYLKISLKSLEAGLAQSLYKAIHQKMNEMPIDGFILNLLNNGGGYIPEAANVVSLFVKDRTIGFYHKGARFTQQATPYHTTNELFINDQLPLVVQANVGTQSAAEFITMSLKALNRSVTVGGHTFGKLIGQIHAPLTLSDGRAMILMVSALELFGPEGEALNGIGISPDLQVYSKIDHGIKDGNSPAKDYVVENPEIKTYRSWLTSNELNRIRSAIEIDQSDVDQVSIEVLTKGDVRLSSIAGGR